MRGAMKLGRFVIAAALLAAGAAEERADFTTGTGTNGWTVSNGVYASPLYSNAVDRISLSYASSVVTDVATVYATASGGAEAQIATLSAASSAAAIDFPDTTDFRSFRVTTAGGMALKSFSALVSESHLESPAGVAISNNVTGTSFDASWGAVEGALGYKVYVWTNVIAGASEGTAVWSETFPGVPGVNVNNNTTEFLPEEASNAGWTRENVFATVSPGVVRIGSSSKAGWLASPALPGFEESSLALRFTANRYNKDTGVAMPISIVRGTTTNDFASVSLTTNSAVYSLPLPALAAGDRIVFHSTTNKLDGRVALDDVAIVQGATEGHEEPVYIVDGRDVGGATECELTGLPSEPVLFAVEAYGRRGAASAKSEPVEVDLANPERVAVLNACLMSSLGGRIYLQGFDPLARHHALVLAGVQEDRRRWFVQVECRGGEQRRALCACGEPGGCWTCAGRLFHEERRDGFRHGVHQRHRQCLCAFLGVIFGAAVGIQEHGKADDIGVCGGGGQSGMDERLRRRMDGDKLGAVGGVRHGRSARYAGGA